MSEQPDHGDGPAQRLPGAGVAVAFVGVGAIGLPMAVRIAQAGHRVTAVDPSSERRDLAARSGLAGAAALAEARASVTIVMVATPDQLQEVASVAPAAPGSLWIVMSTVGPAAVRAAAETLAGHGVDVLDVPVTGGVAGATAGRLTLFAAGDPQVLERARPVLDPLGTVHDCGPDVGGGQAVKMVNQLMAAVNLVGAAEGLALAATLGLDPVRIRDLLSTGAAGSWMLDDRGPRMLKGTDVEVTSMVDIFVKDTGLVVQAADEVGFDASLARVAAERFRAASAQGLGRRDDSRVIETYRPPPTVG